VKAAFDGANWVDHQVAAQALATAGEVACAPELVKLLENAKARPEARVDAAVALGPIDDPVAKTALADASKNEKNAAIRAAAILAQVRPNAGRGKVLAMVQIIRDPAPELRAAACAGIVRAGGDSNLEDLYVLFKDTDARPSEATLRELDRLHSEAALNLVARLARRPQLSVEKMAAEILVRRRARPDFSSLKAYLAPATDARLRGMALVAADETLLASLAGDVKTGIWVYRAYLARGERDRGADWLLAHASKLSPAELAEALVDWAESSDSLPVATADARKPRR
jgi:hypothetical protein